MLETLKMDRDLLDLRPKLSEIGSFVRENSLKIAGIGLAGLTLAYIGKMWHDYGTFKRLGIASPKKRFFFGHYKEIMEKNYSEALREWTTQYGSVYG